jgi:hypothetical protein
MKPKKKEKQEKLACTQCGGRFEKNDTNFYRRSDGRFHRECKDCFKSRVKLNRSGITSARYAHI